MRHSTNSHLALECGSAFKEHPWETDIAHGSLRTSRLWEPQISISSVKMYVLKKRESPTAKYIARKEEDVKKWVYRNQVSGGGTGTEN